MARFQEIINSGQPVLVDFFATWCGPCQNMMPVVEQLAADFKGKAKVLKVDIDKNPQAAAAFKVRGVPTFIVFKDGNAVWRQSGMLPKMELEKAVNSFL